MLNSQERETKTLFVERLSQGIHKIRRILWVFLLAAVIFLVGYFVWTEWQRRTDENSSLLAEEAQDKYQRWQEEMEEEKKQGLEEELQATLSLIVDRYPRKYATQRALFIWADLFFAQEEWEQAAEKYQKLAEDFPQSYLSPLSLFNAAVCRERMDQPERALTLYAQITAKDSYLIPQALFSLGRLHEQQEDFENAFTAYDRLDNEYPLSNWTKAGRNRIIQLKIQGRITP